MEEFKTLDKLTEIDKKHILWGEVTGLRIDLPRLHDKLSKVELNKEVPDDLLG